MSIGQGTKLGAYEVQDFIGQGAMGLVYRAYHAQLERTGAVKVMLAQGTGGCLLFNVSKQAVNPGKDFGPYGLPKAATLFVVKQYALDHGADGIRANGVNAAPLAFSVSSGFVAGTWMLTSAK